MEAIKTDSVSKNYGRTRALSEVSIAVKTGDVYGFLGPNGAGKTTMIRILLGLLKPDRGRIELLGEEVSRRRSTLLPRIGAVLAPPSFYPHLTGEVNLRLFSQLAETEDRVPELLEQVDLSVAGNKRFSDYSAGMKQRLAIAAALLKDPDLFILDEPTSGLDPQGRIGIREIIRNLGQSGRTIFLSTHLLNEVQQVCNRVGVLKEGELIAEDEVSRLLGEEEEVLIRVPSDGREEAKLALESADFVSSVSLGEHYLRVSLARGDNSDLIELLQEAGVEVEEIKNSRKNLEEVFVELTEEGA